LLWYSFISHFLHPPGRTGITGSGYLIWYKTYGYTGFGNIREGYVTVLAVFEVI
jgi:hypothetical protein